MKYLQQTPIVYYDLSVMSIETLIKPLVKQTDLKLNLLILKKLYHPLRKPCQNIEYNWGFTNS